MLSTFWIPEPLPCNMKIKCPTCRKLTEWQDNPFRPFCSERCKLIDLGAWASDGYRIEGEKIPGGSQDDREQNSG